MADVARAGSEAPVLAAREPLEERAAAARERHALHQAEGATEPRRCAPQTLPVLPVLPCQTIAVLHRRFQSCQCYPIRPLLSSTDASSPSNATLSTEVLLQSTFGQAAWQKRHVQGMASRAG